MPRVVSLFNFFALSLIILGGGCMSIVFAADENSPTSNTKSKWNYPTTRQDNVVDNYHGTEVADPYRWLEDTNSAETKAWTEAQNALTFSYLEGIPARENVKKRLTELWDFERFGLPEKRGSRYFYTRNDGLQNQSVLYVADSLNAEPRVLLDPNTLSTDGTVALAGSVPSDDGRWLAYGVATAGSDWREWRVRDVVTGEDRSDKLEWVKFSGASWLPDSSGFYYSRYDAPAEGKQFTGVNYFQKLYFHKLGDDQSKDVLVYERPDQKEWGFGGDVSEDGRFLIISVWRGSERKNQIFYRDLTKPDSAVVELITGFDAAFNFIGNDGQTLWIETDWEAPMHRVIAVNVSHPDRKDWKTLIPEAGEVLEAASVVGDSICCSYLKDAASRVLIFDRTGAAVREVELPALGTASGFAGRRKDTETFYAFSNYTTPGSVYRYDLTTGKSDVFRAPKLAFDPNAFETKQVFIKSKDGTRVPMFLSYKKGLKLDGSAPTLLYAYGGFNISQTPSFSVSNVVWMEMGGVYAVANLRGGGEYGRQWHEAGMRIKKQNVFDDFISAAEWLIEKKYTTSSKLAVRGGSNGGLLIGAVMTQRPELFGACLPAVGVMDMLRYHKFTIGWAWVGEYGSSDVAEEFKTLYAYSPLHNLRPANYPATMVMTADHDDRVVPGHSFKFAAALQAAQKGPAPTFIRVETRAGHGAGTPTSKLIESSADVLAFLIRSLNVDTQ